MSTENLRPILLVEDSLKDIQLIRAALQKVGLDRDLVVVRDGAEALDYLHRRGAYSERPGESPTVVLLDLKMPRVDGFQVLREIRDDRHLKLVPVVVMTSSQEETDVLKSYQFGANAYVVKPVGFPQLVDSIRNTGVFWAMINHAPTP